MPYKYGKAGLVRLRELTPEETKKFREYQKKYREKRSLEFPEIVKARKKEQNRRAYARRKERQLLERESLSSASSSDQETLNVGEI